MAEGGEVCQIVGMDSEDNKIEKGHEDPFLKFLSERMWIVILIFTLKKDPEDLSSSENWQDVLECSIRN